MPALDLRKRIAECVQEIIVRRLDRAVQFERNHGLRLADCGNLARKVRGVQFGLGDVRRVFHDLECAALLVENRVVGRENPDFLAALADPLELPGLVFATAEFGPELAIGRTVAHLRLDEYAVMLALNFGKRIAERLQEILVGGHDGAVQIELDRCLDAVDRHQLARIFHRPNLFLGDVGRELHDLRDRAVAGEDRVVGGMNPHFPAALGDPLEYSGLTRPSLAQNSR
jgi:hypothetical protein